MRVYKGARGRIMIDFKGAIILQEKNTTLEVDSDEMGKDVIMENVSAIVEYEEVYDALCELARLLNAPKWLMFILNTIKKWFSKN